VNARRIGTRGRRIDARATHTSDVGSPSESVDDDCCCPEHEHISATQILQAANQETHSEAALLPYGTTCIWEREYTHSRCVHECCECRGGATV